MILQGDVLDKLAEMEAESVSCVVTDPPYNVGKDFGNGPNADRRQDYDEWLLSVWAACGRVVEEGCFLIYTNRIGHLPMGMLAVPEPWRFMHVGVWHKPLALAGCWYSIAPHWEPIFIYVKGKPWRPFRSEFVMADAREHNVVTGGKRGHPTQKPRGLMRDLVAFACRPGGTVLDPFCGSGTTLVAAAGLGFAAVGIDSNADYCDIARRRLLGIRPDTPDEQAVLPLAAATQAAKEGRHHGSDRSHPRSTGGRGPRQRA